MRLEIDVVKTPDIRAIQQRFYAAISREMEEIGKDTEGRLGKRVRNWTEKPTFYWRSLVTPGAKWLFEMRHKSGTEGGKRYNWVRLGTGLHGPKRAAYPIYPVNARVLRFTTPHSPKTLAPGQSRPGGPKTVVFTTKVDKPGMTHPGIKPRNDTPGFPGNIRTEYFVNTVRPNSFFQRIRRAGRRGLR